MWIQILGPVSADLGTRAANLGGPKQRTVFALLALRANYTVGVEDLINDVWEDDPPGRPRKTLQVYVANLRRELGDSAASESGGANSDGAVRNRRISSGAFGYQLRAGVDELDLARYEALVARARARGVAEPLAAIRDFESALEVWSGPRSLADLSGNAAVARLVRPLEDARADVVEELMSLRVRHGSARSAVAALPDLIAADPWREGLWGLLMQGYYATGRQVEALETYQRVRKLMIDELGVEPGPELRELEQRILAQDPSLTAESTDPRAPSPSTGSGRASSTGADSADPETGAPPVGRPSGGALPPADERRTATLVAVGLADPESLLEELDPEDLAELTDRLRERVGAVIGEHGGSVLTSGEEGVVAAFGYPNAAEDDPQQAVRAALAASRTLPAVDLPAGVGVGVGVHTGLSLFRGSPRRATGQAPGIAVRLQRAAAIGQVLLSSQTATLVAAEFTLAWAARPIALPSELTAVAVVGELPPPLDEYEQHELGGLVGREVELARLQALDSAPEPVVVAVLGEAGIGKTALVGAYLAELGRSGARAMIIRSDRHRRSEALYPIGQALAARYAGREELELDLGLHGVPQPVLAETSTVLAELAGWSAPERRSPLQAVTVRQAAVTTWLAALAASRPLRLVVEDLQYLDTETVTMLDDAIDELNHGLVLVTSREETLPSRMAAAAQRIELDRLSVEQARVLVRQIAAPVRLRLGLVNTIVELAAGHPLHLRELSRQSAAGPVGYRTEDVPATLNASLLARLDRLGPAKALAQRCAVIGDRFDLELAALVSSDLGLSESELSAELDALVSDGVLRRSGPVQASRYVFAQGLLEDVAYASLPRSIRVELHQRVAARLARPGEPPTAQLAEHLEAAGQLLPAVLGWIQASETALQATSFAEAQQYARRALAAVPQLPTGPETDRMLMMAKLLLATAIKMTVFADEELVEVSRSAYELLDASPDLRLKVLFYPGLIATLQAIGHYDEAVLRGAEALEIARRAGEPEGEKWIRQVHAATLIWMGRLDEASVVHDPTDFRPDPASEPSLLIARLLSGGAGLSLAGLVAQTRGHPDESRMFFDQSRTLARHSHLLHSTCLADATQGVALQLAGDAAGTQQLAEDTMALAVQLGTDLWFVWGQALLGWSLAVQGNPEEGLAVVEEAISTNADVRQLLPYFNTLAASAELLAGRADAALTRLRTAAAMAEETGERFFLPYVHRVTVDALLASGADEEEVTLHRRIALDLATEQGQQLFADQVAGAY